MNESGERHLWLALVAAVPLGTLVSLTLGLTLLTALFVGLIAMTLLAGSAMALWSWQHVRWLHQRSHHWALTLVAIGMPGHYCPVWLEQMQAQLNELDGAQRRKFLVDMVLTAPKNWLVVGWSRLQSIRASRFRGNEFKLAYHLVMVLAPDGARTSRVDMLHAIGISRLQNRQASHNVLALRLAQQLLTTENEHFKVARRLAADLLIIREHIHLMTRDVLRRHLRVWPGQGHPPHSLRYDELDKLRGQAFEQSQHLRAALVAGIAREFGLT